MQGKKLYNWQKHNVKWNNIIREEFMKKSIIRLSVALAFTGLFLNGCDNFLNGSEIKKDIEDKIEYETSRPITIYIGDTERTCKVGDTINLTYSVPDGYAFKKWIVLDAKGSEVSDYFEIEDSSMLKTKAKILKSADSFVIKPVCLLLPKVVDHFPKDTLSGYPQDTNIILTFNKPVPVFNFFTDQEKLKNIHIYRNKKEITNTCFSDVDYFESSDNSGNKIYCLTIHTNKAVRILDDSLETAELSVEVDTTFVKDEDGLEFGNNYAWTYKVNPTVDSVGPEFKEFHVYRTKNVDGTYSDELSTEDLNTWNDSTFRQNHFKGPLYYTCKVSDNSGIGTVRIIENGITQMNGSDYHYDEYESVTFKKIENDTYQCEGQYNCREDFNGLLKIGFDVKDYAGNPIDKKIEVYAVKDTIANIPDIKIYNNCPFIGSGIRKIETLYTNEITIKDIKDSVKKVYFSANDIWLIKNGKIYSDYINLISVKLYTEEKNEIPLVFEKGRAPDNSECYILNLTDEQMDSSSDIFIKLNLQDDIGNTIQKEYAIPSKGEILGVGRYDHDSDGYDSFAVNINGPVDLGKSYYYVYVAKESFETSPDASLACLKMLGGDILIETATERYIPHYAKINKKYIYENDNGEKFNLYGTTGKEVILLHDPKTLDESVKIPDFTWNLENGPINSSGKRIFTYEYENDFIFDSDYTYFVTVYMYDSNGFWDPLVRSANTYLEFTRGTNNNYDLIARSGVMDSYGNIKEAHEKTIPKNLLKDRSAPIAGGAVIDKYGLGSYCSDEYKGSGLKNENGFVTIKYSLKPYYKGCNQITVEDVKNMPDLKSIKVPYTNIDEYGDLSFNIPLYDIPDGNYYMAGLVYDNEGNYGSGVDGVPVWIYKAPSDFNIVYDKDKYLLKTIVQAEKIPINIDFQDHRYEGHNLIEDYYYYHTIYYYDETSGQWTEYESQLSGADIWLSGEADNCSIGDTITTVFGAKWNDPEPPLQQKYRNKFAKIHTKLIDFGTDEAFAMYMTPKYIYTGDTNVSIRKFDQFAEYSYIAKSDKPYIIETYVSSIGYGDSIDDWVARAEPKNPQVMEGLDYYIVKPNDIPNGYYYTAIIHFADGTFMMGEVKRN